MSKRASSKTGEFEIKVVGKSGQISLGKRYAGKVLRLDRLEDGSVLLTAVAIVPESQLWTIAEPDLSAIARGLAWAAATPTKAGESPSRAVQRSRPAWSVRFAGLAGSAEEFPLPDEPPAVESGPDLD